MKHLKNRIIIALLFNLIGLKTFAQIFSVENNDGVTIYYAYINNGKDLAVSYLVCHYYSDESSSDNTFIVYSHKGYEGVEKIIIPEKVTYMNRTRTVTSIGACAFAKCKDLKTVVLPNTITKIGKGAFYDCKSLSTINMPTSLTEIGVYAFPIGNGAKIIIKDIGSWCKVKMGKSMAYPLNGNCLYSDERTEIKDLIIPNNVEVIRRQTFFNCKNLKTVKIPSSVTTIEQEAFRGCDELSSVIIGGDYNGYSGNTIIEKYAFTWCEKLTSLVLGNNVSSIGFCAFDNCSLTSLTLPSSISSISQDAFTYNKIIEVTSYITELFELPSSAFDKETKYNATLNVVKGYAEKYRAKKGWREFLWIEETLANKIDKVILEDDKSVYYDIWGHQINKPSSKGVYIKNGTKRIIK